MHCPILMEFFRISLNIKRFCVIIWCEILTFLFKIRNNVSHIAVVAKNRIKINNIMAYQGSARID